MSIKAVVFDLDDTLFPEIDYVKSGYNAVAQEIEKTYGIKNADKELFELFEKDRKNVFDRFLKNHALTDDETSVGELVNVYRAHTPNITLSDEVKQTLIKLRTNGYKLGVITDGRPDGQRLKIAALELNKLVDKIIITEELGGEQFRKPNPAAFEQMAREFNINLDEMMYVGDNPKKDFAVKEHLPIKTVRIESGLYVGSDYLHGIREDCTISGMSELENNVLNNTNDNQTVIREKLLSIMDFIHNICKNEGIKYSLGYGSLIGAIRHEGFIPWDDDMDILMTRDDYNRFVVAIKKYSGDDCEFELARKVLKVPCVRYKQAPIVNSKRYDGIQIDIFIFDNYPDESSKQKQLIFKLKTLQGMMHKDKINWSNYSFKGKVLLFGTKVLGLFRSKKSLIKSYDKLSGKYNNIYTKTKYVSNASFANMQKQYANELLETTVEARFEDRMYDIYSAYDELLHIWYGDYMTLPPVEQRVPQHDITVTEV